MLECKTLRKQRVVACLGSFETLQVSGQILNERNQPYCCYIDMDCWQAIVSQELDIQHPVVFRSLQDAIDAGAQNICVRDGNAGNAAMSSINHYIKIMRGAFIGDLTGQPDTDYLIMGPGEMRSFTGAQSFLRLRTLSNFGNLTAQGVDIRDSTSTQSSVINVSNPVAEGAKITIMSNRFERKTTINSNSVLGGRIMSNLFLDELIVDTTNQIRNLQLKNNTLEGTLKNLSITNTDQSIFLQVHDNSVFGNINISSSANSPSGVFGSFKNNDARNFINITNTSGTFNGNFSDNESNIRVFANDVTSAVFDGNRAAEVTTDLLSNSRFTNSRTNVTVTQNAGNLVAMRDNSFVDNWGNVTINSDRGITNCTLSNNSGNIDLNINPATGNIVRNTFIGNQGTLSNNLNAPNLSNTILIGNQTLTAVNFVATQIYTFP